MYRCRVSLSTPTSVQSHAITTLADTWFGRKAYNRVKEVWMKRVSRIKADQGNTGVGRWNDFKIGYDESHRGSFSSAKKPLLVTDATGTQAAMASSNEEWELSSILDNDGNGVSFRFLSTATTSNVYNVLSAYGHTDNVFSPDPEDSGTGGNSLGDLFLGDGGDQSGMDEVGDYPPYHETAFPQQEVLQAQLCTIYGLGAAETAAGIQRMSTGYFDVPLGLIKITNSADVEITIEVQEGDYKGVNAPEWK